MGIIAASPKVIPSGKAPPAPPDRHVGRKVSAAIATTRWPTSDRARHAHGHHATGALRIPMVPPALRRLQAFGVPEVQAAAEHPDLHLAGCGARRVAGRSAPSRLARPLPAPPAAAAGAPPAVSDGVRRKQDARGALPPR
jgi:hypothetical protein